MKSVSGKVALITGGAGGIGCAVVTELLKNKVKAAVVVDISDNIGPEHFSEITKQNGNQVIFIKNDVTDTKELEEAFDITIKTFKQLDIVINNAGIINEIEWKKLLAVNLMAVVEGTYLALQKYLPKYKSEDEAVIVNTASVLGMDVIQSSPTYCTSKHGLIGLGRALGGEEFYKKYGVRVLTLCPGLILTPLTQNVEERNMQILFPDIVMRDFQTVNSAPQGPERVAEALIEIIRNGKNGSVWVTEEDKPVYEVDFPSHKAMRK